ncbi:MAG: hypothetical protein U0235_33060 [Polyangiaceae bacterium]
MADAIEVVLPSAFASRFGLLFDERIACSTSSRTVHDPAQVRIFRLH